MVLGADWLGRGGPPTPGGPSVTWAVLSSLGPPHWGPSLRSPRKERPGGVREEAGKQGVPREQAGPGAEEGGSPGQGQLSVDLPVA